MTLPSRELKDSLRDPDLPYDTAKRRNPRSSKPLYRVYLYLDGSRLPYVHSVTYLLHHTFSEPSRQVFRTPSNPRCKLEIRTWGLFRVQAIVTDRDGNNIATLTHDLQYDKEFSEVQFTAA